MSFSLGLSIASCDVGLDKFLLSNILFSVSSPIGVLIGGFSFLFKILF